MDYKKYDEAFIEKYHDDAEDNNYLYEYKTGEFQGGEVIGMITNASKCEKFEYPKNTAQEYIPIIEFYSEEGYRENDLQFPIFD